MKIVNEKGKLFGIINIVDLIVLIAVLCVAGGIVWKLAGSRVAETVSPKAELTAVAVITGASSYLVDEMQRVDPVGQKMVSGNAYVGAEITKVWVENYYYEFGLENGSVAYAPHPSKKDIFIEFKMEVPRDATGYSIGSQDIRVGKTFIVKTKTLECNATIYRMDLAE